MKSVPSFDDLRLFLAVAASGSLSAAARITGSPVPTLSRRMARLERDLDARLFLRGPSGYALTARGHALEQEAAPLSALARRLDRFRDGTAPMRVRITAGLWTSMFLAAHIRRVWRPDAPWVPEFVASNARIDIARRAADIGIRNARPDQPWLAGRRTRRIDYAEFAADPGITGYIALAEGQADTPSGRWLRAERAEAITTTASDMRLAADLARAGLGRVVLPVFAGRMLDGLVQVAAPIDTIAHDEWLVSHHEARHDPATRAALDALAPILTDPELRPAP
ncbi:MAG: LysR family transcriptional regulator [Rhodobacteraceae bacterium HLUCCA08]|nr:MAG: LysR family transcriptional regulator [Rhodobacteraceae bacterium HLUCCA08]